MGSNVGQTAAVVFRRQPASTTVQTADSVSGDGP